MFHTARRALLALGLACASLAFASPPSPALAQPYATTELKYAAIVVDANTGEVLFAKNADAPRYPASISKMMTLYLAFEALSTGRMRANEEIVVSQHAASMSPSKLGVRAGQSIDVEDALQATAVHSANDMAVAIAERIGGSEPRFAALMTLRAQELGMSNTHYVNASGLPDSRQISSARDIAILARAIMRDYPQYYHYFSERDFTYNGRVMTNHNHLLGKMPGVDGLKTGFTNASGFNLAASAVRNNRRLIAVVLGGNSTAARDAHVEDLIDTGFDVLRRRQMGERITIAQNLFEPAPIGPILRPSVEQGSGDQDGLKIVLTDNPAGARAANAAANRVAQQPVAIPVRAVPVKTVKADPAPTAKPVKVATAKASRKAAGDWRVQVGAYKSKTLAQAQLSTLSKKFSDKFADADKGVEDGANGYYRARFAGFSADEARQACEALQAHRMSCMVVSPSR